MIAPLGSLTLALGLILATYGAASAIAGYRRRSAVLVESARTTAFSVLAMTAAACGLMLAALLSHDFAIRYVAENGSRETPTFFTVLSLWSDDAGSLLLWNLILAGYIAAVAWRFRRARPESFPWALATMYATQIFFLFLTLVAANPFGTLANPPADGNGPLPLLQNHPLMAAHPPLLYLGFIGFTVPFGFAVASLVTGDTSDEWLRTTRRWTMFAWGFLTAGLFVGALWSYGVLGWGGYWAWDPVENVALLPWITGTAYLHSVIVQERRGMLKLWNLSLIVGTYALTILGTFLTRGSILLSVHTFAASLVGPLYLGFLGLVLLVGFGLLVYRAERLGPDAQLDGAISRESAFLGNNLLFLSFAFSVLIGTIYPLLAEAFTGDRLSVGGPFFRRTTIPLALLLILLMGAAPLLQWRRTSPRILRSRLSGPSWIGMGTAAIVLALGVRNVAATVAFGAAAFVIAGIVERFAVGIRPLMRSQRVGPLRALGRLVRSNRRLYGGLVVHLGIVVAAIAITVSSSFATDVEANLQPGQTTSLHRYTLRLTGTRQLQQPQRRVAIADLEVLHAGRRIGRLSPSLNFYPNSNAPIGSPAIRVGGAGDLYTSLTGIDATDGTASIRVFYTPGVLWLWVGGGIMLIGTALAGWPPRRKRAPRPLAPLESIAEQTPVGEPA